ncbi:2-dehydropantoate 2-reductase-like protein [Ampelomyces quisqualis]|uniref:2-dehydropantoate 2-reductase-like protein n=1 Tax=Ampelomyces quisqualis TaxID=50730 RepID=A0A6A5QTE9_AMPQU|nr:2-dehydropantoate 2-reductase-like protein [Ampelomyces quisqualis]
MNKSKPVDILIFGTGAVGSTLGRRLAQNANTRLSVVCRLNYDIVRRQGLSMKTNIWNNGTFRHHRVARSTRDVSDLAFDYVVCANKITASDASSTIRELAPVVSPSTALVSAQNGVGVEAPLGHAFHNNTILSAVCNISCLQPVPGIVQQISKIRPHAIHVGVYDTPGPDGAVHAKEKLADFVALDCCFKQVNDLDTVRQLTQETFNVAIALGILLPKDLLEKTIQFARNNPSTAPSMLQDARKKRLMEVDSLCGNIFKQAEQVRVPVPTMRLVYYALLEMERNIQ